MKKPMKPVPPQKPSATKLAAVANRSSPGPSTPPERRKKSVSPPPLPPRKNNLLYNYNCHIYANKMQYPISIIIIIYRTFHNVYGDDLNLPKNSAKVIIFSLHSIRANIVCR